MSEASRRRHRPAAPAPAGKPLPARFLIAATAAFAAFAALLPGGCVESPGLPTSPAQPVWTSHELPAPRTNRVGLDGDDLVIVGDDNVIGTWDGDGWNRFDVRHGIDQYDLEAVDVGPDGHLVAVGDYVWIRRPDGSTRMLTAADFDFLSVKVVAGGEFWACGWYGQLLHFLDENVVVRDSPTDEHLGCLDVNAAGEVYAGSTHGSSWRRRDDAWTRLTAPAPSEIYDIWAGAGPDSVFAVNHRGMVLQLEGDAWAVRYQDIIRSLFAVDVIPGRTVLAVGAWGTYVLWQGEEWVRGVVPGERPLMDVRLLAEDEALAIDDIGGVWRWRGGTWRREGQATLPLLDVAALPDGGILGVGYLGYVYQTDALPAAAADWEIHYLDREMDPLHLRWQAPDRLYLQGIRKVLRLDGFLAEGEYAAGTSLQANPMLDLHALAVLEPGAALAAGERGYQLQLGGAWHGWREPGLNRDVLAAWGDGEGGAWLVGTGGQAWRYAEGRLAGHPTGVLYDLRAVHGLGPDDVLAVGDRGSVAQWDGSAWRPRPAPTLRPLTCVAPLGPGEYVIGGRGGALYRGDGRTWLPVDLPGDADVLDLEPRPGGGLLVLTADRRLHHLAGWRQ